MESHLEISINILYRKHVRDFLNELIFKGFEVTYIESKYFFSSKFIVKGDSRFLKCIMESIQNWKNEMDKIDEK